VESLADRQIAPLLELDPDLGQLLDGGRLATAQRELRVSTRVLPPGVWDTARIGGASPEHIGLLVIEGVIAREVLVSDIVSTELLGPGDLVRPWQLDTAAPLLAHTVRWTVLARTHAALLDRRFAADCGRYPEIGAAVVDRVNQRALRLAITQAISQLNRVDRRLLALLWHLAERWGRMTSDGVALPMTLSHRMLGQLVGARRPTVSTALSELARQGVLARRSDGTWLLTSEPIDLPRPDSDRVIPIRRRLLPAGVATAPAVAAAVEVHDIDHEGLRQTLRQVRERCETSTGQIREVMLQTTRLTEDNAMLRARCRVTRQQMHNGGARLRAVEG
jgi:CRP/FNR family transcriptional regulator, cyclic AMP receptor protein